MWDPALIELFRSEVEMHSETLNSALLELERAPGDSSRIDEMMRAAHSIKGAACVVGVDPAVRVAHAMEDCFVAAQKGTLKLGSGDVDVLLRGVDLVSSIVATTANPEQPISQELEADVQGLVSELEAVLGRRGNSAAPTRSPAVVPPTVAPAPAATVTTTADIAPAAPARSTPEPAPQAMRAATISFPSLLDAAAAESARQRLVSAVEARSDSIRFDLSQTEDLDVHGLAFLAAVPEYLADNGPVKLELKAVSHSMQTVLRVTGLDVALERASAAMEF